MRWWTPPDPLAFTDCDVDRALEAGSVRTPSAQFFDRPVGELAGPAGASAIDRLHTIAEKITTTPIGTVSWARILEYPAGAGGLPWHRDRLTDNRRHAPPQDMEEAENRVLSCTVQLSGPDDYEGGYLEAESSGSILRAPRERGAVVFFASTTPHRLTPVTAGCRLSLAAFWGRPPHLRTIPM